MFKRKELTEEQIKEIRASEAGLKKLAKQFGVNDARIKAIKEAATDKEAIEVDRKPQKQAEQVKEPPSQGTKLAAIGTKGGSAPVTFVLSNDKIELDPADLLDSYLLYKDLRARAILREQLFSGYMRDGAGLLWTILSAQPLIKEGEIELEVNNGRGIRESEAAAKAG